MGNMTERVSATYYAEIGRSDTDPVFDPVEEKQLLRAWQAHGDREARDRVVETHLRFVVKQAHRRTKDPEAVKDYIAAGNVGLLEAADRFDWRRRPYIRFLTFAGWWILKEMSEFDYSSSTVVHVPPHRQKEQRRNARAYAAAVREHGPESVVACKMDPGLLQGRTVAMTEAVRDRHCSLLEKGLDGSKIGAVCDVKRVRAAIHTAISHLPLREQTVLNLYFGVKDEPRNLRQIAVMMEMSDELVRQLKIRGIRLLHDALHGKVDLTTLTA